MNGIVAALGGGAMAGNTVHIHADLHTAPVTAIDAAVGGLGGNDELHLAAGILGTAEILIYDGLPAHTVAVLFLNGAHHHQLVALGDQVQVLHDLDAIGGGSHATLLVTAAAAIDDVLGLVALVGVSFPVFNVADAHGVDVGVDDDDLVAGAHPADDIAQLIELDLVVAQGLHFFGDALGNALLLAGLRGNGNHVAQELDHCRLIAFRGFLDGFKIHSEPPYFQKY